MWHLLPTSGINVALVNPSNSARYGVEVMSEMIRNGESKMTFDVIDAGAQVTLDTFSAWGTDNGVVITWHERDDRSDQIQRWRSEMPS